MAAGAASAASGGGIGRALLAEWPLAIVLATTGLFAVYGNAWLGEGTPRWQLGLLFVWLFVAILWAAIRVVHHAECLAVRLGEPLGTLILTLSVISIEVMMISAVMLTGEQSPTLARDTMFAVVMIVLNGMVGVTLLVGAIKFREQTHNLQGANAYLNVIIPLAVLSMVLPAFTVTTPGPTLSGFQQAFLIVISIALYAVFLLIQTRRHTTYFTMGDKPEEDDGHAGLDVRSIPFHAVLLLCYLVPVVLMAKKIAIPIDYGIRQLGAPVALGGFLVAALVLAPEAMGAIRSALDDRLQRAVNIFLGSVLATIGLTVPAVLTIGLMTGKEVVLGIAGSDLVLLLLTLFVSAVTFSAERTNLLQGAVHLVLFLAYLMLIFAP